MFLVFILAVLSLSEVIIGFSWSCCSRARPGCPSLLVWLGLQGQPQPHGPGFMALLVGLCFWSFPYTVLVLYPALSRLDPELPEASRVLGASPLRIRGRALLHRSILAALIMVFVFNLGAFVLPQVLGQPGALDPARSTSPTKRCSSPACPSPPPRRSF